MAVPDINPLALIGKYRADPIDHGPVQKLLTDAHIQGMKNKAAAARNLLAQKTAFANKLVGENLHPGQEFISRIGMNPTGLAQALQTSRGLADKATTAGTFRDHMAGLLSGKKASINPTVQAGTPAQIAGGNFTVTPGLPVQEQVVTNITDEATGYRPPRPGEPFTGYVKGKQSTGTKTKQGPVGPKTDAEQLFKAGRQDQLRYGMEQSAKHLNISVRQLVDIVVKGLQDGSVTFFRDPAKNGSGVIINGQRHFWK